MDTATIMARLLYRDALMLILDKPAGLPVHRERGALQRETLTDWLDDLRFGLPRRPELAHRLDRETSGCLVLGRHPRALARLSSLFAAGQAEKLYWAVVEGVPREAAGTIDLPLAEEAPGTGGRRMRPDPRGKPAVTRWRLLASAGPLSWLELAPVTGRTHQLRVHCAASGWPILGDRRYGRGPGPLMLHARRISLPLYPKKPPVVAEAPAPAPLAAAIARIERGPD
ncbi:RluA family pseudouridine synthase [Enterovirga sp.]|uniref:RluA family pseudouridine synthase n=1 Tax=Enterovirga sp. TaxID=2026350 RepID=UPI003FA5E8D0